MVRSQIGRSLGGFGFGVRIRTTEAPAGFHGYSPTTSSARRSSDVSYVWGRVLAGMADAGYRGETVRPLTRLGRPTHVLHRDLVKRRTSNPLLAVVLVVGR